MRLRLLPVPFLAAVSGVAADPYPHGGHVEFPAQANTAHDWLEFRLVATTPSTPGRLTFDRIERNGDTISVYTTVESGPNLAFGEAMHSVASGSLESAAYRIEFHARAAVRTTDEYTLLDAVHVAFVARPAVVPAMPSTIEPAWIVTTAAPGCGPVLSSSVEQAMDPQTGPDVVLPADYTYTVSLNYAEWPCPADGASDLAPIRIALPASGDLVPGPPEGRHTVRFIQQQEGSGTAPAPDAGVLAFRSTTWPGARAAGTWFNPQHLGQGVQTQVLPSGVLLVSWYTFDAEGVPATIIAQGSPFDLDGVILAGGRFPTIETSAGEPQPWGELELSFNDCNNATLTWDTDHTGFTNGSLALTRLSSQIDAECSVADASAPTGGEWQVVDAP